MGRAPTRTDQMTARWVSRTVRLLQIACSSLSAWAWIALGRFSAAYRSRCSPRLMASCLITMAPWAVRAAVRLGRAKGTDTGSWGCSRAARRCSAIGEPGTEDSVRRHGALASAHSIAASFHPAQLRGLPGTEQPG